MARLTKQVKDGYFVLNCDACEMKGENCTPMGCLQVATKRLAAYEETLLEPKEVAGLCAMDKRSRMAKMLRWEEAEQDGRLVVLPCKVGATVYGHSKDEVSEYEVTVISLATYNWYLRCQNHNSDFWVTDADIGKTVFLTREEAEATMKEANHA